jgi:hypothetical protein
MSSAPLQPTSMNRSNVSNHNSALPPKHKGTSGGSGSSYRQYQGANDHESGGDSLDRMMNKKPNYVPGLENHYSKPSGGRHQPQHSADTSSDPSSSLGGRSSQQKSLGRSEYAEELRKQIQVKKDIDSQLERGHRRSYSNDYTPSSILASPSHSQQSGLAAIGGGGGGAANRGRYGGPRGALSADEYAASLKSQIVEKKTIQRDRDSDWDNNPRNQIKAYSAPEPTRTGRRCAPPGGHSTFSMKWE